MRKLILLALGWITLGVSVQGQGIYTIKGRIDNYNDPAKIYLQYVENGDLITHASSLKNGQFSFSGKTGEPTNGRLVLLPNGGATPSIKKQYPQTLVFMLAAETIEINSPDVLQNAILSGSEINADYQWLANAIALNEAKIDSLTRAYEAAPIELAYNDAYITEIQSQYEHLQAEQKNLHISFIKNHPQSYISLMVLESLSHQADNIHLTDKLLKGLSPEIQNTETGKALASRLNAAKTTTIGSIAPDFTLNTPDNRPVRLSDFRGKYLLIDFWASWCGPCRMENPNLVKAYNSYKNKNFEILGVSLDQPGDKTAWLRAIEKDQLTWPQVSDLGGWQSSVARQYNISTIPQNLLLNPDGVIIAKNLRGNALSTKLAELLQ
jgi:peroxiredoxin